MAIKITDECINCGACEPECPNNAIYEGGVEWAIADGTSVKESFKLMNGTMIEAGVKNTPVADDTYYITPDKCTECQGFHEEPQCAAVCPVDCCIPDEMYRETVDALLEKNRDYICNSLSSVQLTTQFKLISLCLFMVSILCNQTYCYAQHQKVIASHSQYDTTITLLGEVDMIQVFIKKGQILEEGYLKHGKKDGVWTTFHETGFPSSTTSYRNGNLSGIQLLYGADGYIEEMSTYQNNMLNGPYRLYFKGVRINKEIYYTNGIEDGYKKVYYSDGGLQEEGRIKMGKREGLTIWYFINGNKAIEYTYLNGELEGKAAVYNESGIVTQMGTYTNGVQSGWWKEFSDGGQLKEEGEYKNGHKIGNWKAYDQKGQFLKNVNY